MLASEIPKLLDQHYSGVSTYPVDRAYTTKFGRVLCYWGAIKSACYESELISWRYHSEEIYPLMYNRFQLYIL